ncbi:MAG: ceramidase [Gammaproteobacteria bacterium]|nr:ceramidase [Gammaproteobacteria bacterium]
MIYTERRCIQAILVISFASLIFMLALPAIPQDPSYHHFADQVKRLGIHSFSNVTSNIFFLFVGVAGLYHLARQPLATVQQQMYGMFFIGVMATAFGSAWYHLAPGNKTLVWDRLPMSIAFMSLFSIVLYERLSSLWASRLFPMLLVLGIASVGYWHYTESIGHGDLRAYGLVQFLPALLMPVILLCRGDRGRDRYLWLVIAYYALAKLAEFLDDAMFQLLAQTVSGHSVKHVLSAIAAWMVLKHCRRHCYGSPAVSDVEG